MTIDIWSILLEKQLNFCFSVTPAGVEPAIFGMKARRPRPLDDGAP